MHDVRVAFFHADLGEWIVVIPPPGVRRPGYVWQLRKAMYGTRKAAQAWQEYVALGVQEERVDTNSRRGRSLPSPGVKHDFSHARR